MALQPLSAGNSAEFSQADNSKTIERTEINLTSLDSLGSRESIYITSNPKQREKYELNRDLVNSARLQTRPGPFSGEFGSHAWRIRPTPLENSACRLENPDYLCFIMKLLISI